METTVKAGETVSVPCRVLDVRVDIQYLDSNVPGAKGSKRNMVHTETGRRTMLLVAHEGGPAFLVEASHVGR